MLSDEFSYADPWTAALLGSLEMCGMRTSEVGSPLRAQARMSRECYWRWVDGGSDPAAAMEAEAVRRAIVDEFQLAQLAGETTGTQQAQDWVMPLCRQRLADQRSRRRLDRHLRAATWMPAAAAVTALVIGVCVGVLFGSALATLVGTGAAIGAAAWGSARRHAARRAWYEAFADASESSGEAVTWWRSSPALSGPA